MKRLLLLLFLSVAHLYLYSQNIYYKGSRIGEIETDGDVYINGSRVGHIESDG